MINGRHYSRRRIFIVSSFDMKLMESDTLAWRVKSVPSFPRRKMRKIGRNSLISVKAPHTLLKKQRIIRKILLFNHAYYFALVELLI
ncbi:unnamed protein product [Blepharisma stoltei]|uniref:Uncharacterized protein n=1 Tax=Blepharisma stoltei TaxID=1481888 RepID=A0AAU9J9L5_9CILI|nr:unnamed protein product [Blepharisma stoltei]